MSAFNSLPNTNPNTIRIETVRFCRFVSIRAEADAQRILYGLSVIPVPCQSSHQTMFEKWVQKTGEVIHSNDLQALKNLKFIGSKL